jgi:hypothetical protein
MGLDEGRLSELPIVEEEGVGYGMKEREIPSGSSQMEQGQ